jgi:hypothetical protein
MRLKVSEMFARFEFEDEVESLKLSGTEAKQTESQEEWSPSLGMTLAGSIYHSKFLDYTVVTENGFTDGKRTLEYDGSGERQLREQQDYTLNRVNATVNLLREKPYATSLFYLRGRDRREYDRFRSYTTDQEKYGLRVNFQNGVAPWSLRLTHFDETIRDVDRPGMRDEDTGRIQVVHERRTRDKTRAGYTVHQFDQRDNNRRNYQGTSHTLHVSDRQYYGSDDRLHVLSNAHYSDLDTDLSRTIDVTVRNNLIYEHSDTLESRAQYLYGDRDTADARVSRQQLDLSVEHQLYENLTSTLGAEGLVTDARGRRADHDGTRYGPYIREYYTRRLGESARLHLHADVQWHEEERTQAADGVSTQVDRLRLSSTGAPAFLRAPQVQVASITVRAPEGGSLYSENLDYRVVQRGDFVEIQRVVGGRIPENGSVLVEYTAANEGNQKVSTMETLNSIRLELFQRLLVLQARIRRVDNRGGASITFQDLDEQWVSAEFEWKWFRAGVEHEDYNADFLSYKDLRFHEAVVLGETHWLTMRLQLDQSRAEYDQLNEHRDTDSAHLSMRARISPTCDVQVLAGEYTELGDLSDRELTNAQADLHYRIGKVSARITYRYEEEQQFDENRERHYFYVTTKRTF